MCVKLADNFLTALAIRVLSIYPENFFNEKNWKPKILKKTIRTNIDYCIPSPVIYVIYLSYLTI